MREQQARDQAQDTDDTDDFEILEGAIVFVRMPGLSTWPGFIAEFAGYASAGTESAFVVRPGRDTKKLEKIVVPAEWLVWFDGITPDVLAKIFPDPAELLDGAVAEIFPDKAP